MGKHDMRYIVPIILFLIVVYPVCRITQKMGHHPLLGIFWLIPGVNIVMLYVFSSMRWPIEYQCDALLEENERLKKQIEDPSHNERK